ncbi:MAG: Spx/MgsR family RNA polymerase-binding regulatory protein, partial [Fusobacteriaceae bacterium]
MKILLINYKKCSTCIKAKKILEMKGIEFEDISIVDNVPSVEELKEYLKLSGLPLKKFFNTSGNVYKELKLKDILPKASEEEMLNLLASNGMLIKRPILVLKNKVLVGLKEEEWNKYL